MKMTVRAVEEYDDNGFLIYAENYPGAYVRGRTRESALRKMEKEIIEYLFWKDGSLLEEPEVWVDVIKSKPSQLNVEDADSDVIFDSEKLPLTQGEYQELKELALKSAADFYKMYKSVPDPDASVLPVRKTFYGRVPRTAEEMYEHTKDVNAYYFGEIGICADNEGDIAACRKAGFDALEEQMDYLDNHLFYGKDDEIWSLRKVIRRFLWHDRIHAKAMYRMSVQTFGKGKTENPFRFTEK